jgi:hypothetical protein
MDIILHFIKEFLYILFYSFGMFALIYEFTSILYFKTYHNFKYGLYLKFKNRKNQKEYFNSLTNTDNIYFLCNFYYFGWCLFGLFTNNWILFLILLLLPIILSNYYKLTHLIKNILSLLILLRIYLNVLTGYTPFKISTIVDLIK